MISLTWMVLGEWLMVGSMVARNAKVPTLFQADVDTGVIIELTPTW